MPKRLNELQLAAIEFLSVPKRGGLTYEQIANKVGVSAVTLYKWRHNDDFNDELKREIVRKTIDRLPEVMEAVPDIIINDGNAAMLRTLLQAHGLLTDKVEVDNKTGTDSDIESMKAEIERIRNRDK